MWHDWNNLLVPGLYSDWKGDQTDNEGREYLSEFYSLINPAMKGYKIKTVWFNQYLEGAEHPWHKHLGCQFTNCYYLELPDVEYKTEIMGKDGKLVEYTVTEGDVMTCPGWMKHRSKPNGPSRKTVIAWNSNYAS
jgi:hypothetical protein